MTFDGSSPAANTNADKLFRGDREVVTSIVYNFLTFIGSKKKTNLYHVLFYQKVSIRKSNHSIQLLTISLCLLLSFHTVWPEEMAGSKFLFLFKTI